jgi:hypothetical protein
LVCATANVLVPANASTITDTARDTTGFIFFFYSPKPGLFREPAPKGNLIRTATGYQFIVLHSYFDKAVTKLRYDELSDWSI